MPNKKDAQKTDQKIESLLHESRHFAPSADFVKQATVSGKKPYDAYRKEALEKPEEFWGKIAAELYWFKKWDKVMEWNLPDSKWFVGGKTNLSYNCLDRHLPTKGDKTAILWEGEPTENGKFEKRTLTFKELHRQVCKFSNVMKKLGVVAGDRVAIYMPLVPEAAIAMLACTRIGAVHSVIFGGFSAESIKSRVLDAQAKLVITADGGWRRGKKLALKASVDMAIEKVDCVQHVVVLKRTSENVTMESGRDLWWHELMEKASEPCEATPLDSEAPLYILYTSGTTGKPKGILHTTGGYMVGTYLTSKWVFDLKENDIFWCTADIGWVTGHSYVIYGILANGCTTLMYEGAPNSPQPDRFWDIIERYKVTIFYTAPTAIRSFMSWGDEWPEKHNLSSLRLLGSVGEPINPEAWIWYQEKIGGSRCPIVDTWWQTETGAIMISPLPGVVATKPGSATLPLPWVDADIVDEKGKSVPAGKGGLLVIRKPWPSMLRTIYGDHELYKEKYWQEIPGSYFTGDGAHVDHEGYFWIMGRIDDVLNVAGHRLGTMEIESALVSHPMVAEAAVVGMPDAIKGQGIAAFVTLNAAHARNSKTSPADLIVELRQHVTKEIGALARPDLIRFTEMLPKTRSGKIMRRLLKDIAAGRDITSDITTLEDPKVIESLRQLQR